MMGVRLHLLSAGMALVLGLGATSAIADSIIFEGFKYDVTITGYKDGSLIGESAEGQKLYPLKSLDLVQLDGQPLFNKAEAARKEKDWTTAGEMYGRALSQVRPKLKKIVEARALAAFDITGKYPEAIKAFLDIYAASPTPATYALRPQKLPDASSHSLGEAATLISGRLSEGAFNSPGVQQNLKTMLLEIYTQAGDPKAAALATELGVGGPAPAVAPTVASPSKGTQDLQSHLDMSAIEQAMDAKRYDVVIKQVDTMLPGADENSAIKLFMAQAEAYKGLNKPEEAEAAYLRVAIHYSQDTEQAPKALLAAAELEKQTNPGGAQRLYREIVEKYPNSPEALKARTSN